ncbi:hypothetical protein EYZ11_003883 [Aspergillus tanneri]|uniref:Uncharacterized protein n=1 Tax=Aspergillus tanneri TaxID=1220188 RepID=A0A4S3JMB5_9EURO|nr:hypothetical protein EYZ11_003883 [Aspergillus tanneri]
MANGNYHIALQIANHDIQYVNTINDHSCHQGSLRSSPAEALALTGVLQNRISFARNDSLVPTGKKKSRDCKITPTSHSSRDGNFRSVWEEEHCTDLSRDGD